ncbi:MAG: transposase [Acidimicrobiales bacterium]
MRGPHAICRCDGRPNDLCRSGPDHHQGVRPVTRGHGTTSVPRTAKTPVLSPINAETDEARSRVVADVRGATLRKVMAEQINMAASTPHTDEGVWYGTLGQEFAAHHTVNHAAGRYFDPTTKASTNLAEGYFSQLNRSQGRTTTTAVTTCSGTCGSSTSDTRRTG